MSLEQTIENYKNFCSKGQKNVFDIGYRYLGMGAYRSNLLRFKFTSSIL